MTRRTLPIPCPAAPDLRILLLALAALAGVTSRGLGAETPVPASSRPPEQEVRKGDLVRFTSESASHYYLNPPITADGAVYFFPPMPPPLGTAVGLSNPLLRGTAAPAELAPFVNEVFYPLLASRLVDGSVPGAVRQRLEAYRRAKLTLQNELRSQIAALQDADRATRERRLAELAARQNPQILELEATAEAIRAELRRTRLFGAPVLGDDWLEAASLRLREKKLDPDEPAVKADVLRGLAFYQDGLSVVQRAFLRESARESDAAARLKAGVSAGSDPQVVSFLPGPARIRLPTELPPPLRQKIDLYLAACAGLREELGDKLADLSLSVARRTETARSLADSQKPRIAAVEAMAEEIRRELTALPNPPGPPSAAALPEPLLARIALYRSHKDQALKALHALMVRDASDAGPGKPADEAARSGRSLAEFDRTQSRLVSELNKERSAIRAALAEHMRSSGDLQEHKSMDDLLKDFENARERQEGWETFRDYQLAVLLPGLSPEQRRLLYDAAVEQLRLPLPAGYPMR